MPDLPSGTVTLLFTDIEGSTDLVQTLGDRYPAVLADERALLRAAFAAHGGREVDTQGDSFFVAFERASEALAAAVDAQRALAAHPWPQAIVGSVSPRPELGEGPGVRALTAGPGVRVAVRVRMGIHTGEPARTAEGYAGLDLHRAARICAAASGGQILLSHAAADLVRQSLPEGVEFRDLGEHRLKDLRQPEHLHQAEIAGLPADFPPLRSLDTHPNNLPAPSTALIGREQEVEQLSQLLRCADVRLLTLTGPGGTGKTRLGLRLAAEVLHDFRDGAFFVGLAPISDAALIAAAIAQTLGVQQVGARPPEESLLSFLAGKQILLLLDNFEQILPGADLVARLLAACPGLKLLVTSRAALHLSGEHEAPIAPLALPPLGDRGEREQGTGNREQARPGGAQSSVLSPRSSFELLRYAAVSLFVERARAVKPDFAVTEHNSAAVAAICRQLDGLPLAIELAAAWLKLFSPEALLRRLDSDQRLSLLTGGARDLPIRQQTLRDTIAWSYELLESEEQALFRQLSVFVGGATLEAVEGVGTTGGRGQGTGDRDEREQRSGNRDQGVTGDQGGHAGPPLPESPVGADLRVRPAADPAQSSPGSSVLEIVASLVDKSLLQSDETADGDTRFRMLETVREFAWEKLVQHRESEALGRRHAEFFAALAEEAERTLMGPADRGPWFARLDADRHNLRAAVRWALQQREAELGMRLVGALWLWLRRELVGERLRWTEDLLTLSAEQGQTPARAKVLFVAGELAWADEDYERAERRLAESVECWRALRDQRWLAFTLAHLARATMTRDDSRSPTANLATNLATNLEEARSLGLESVRLARELADPWILAWTLIRLADVTSRIGDASTARTLAEEAALLARRLGDRWLLARPIYLLGRSAFVQGDWPAAREHLEEALPARRDADDKLNVSYVLTLLGDIALRQSEPNRAASLAAASLRIAWEIGNRMTIAHDLSLLARVSWAADHLEQAACLLAATEQIRETKSVTFIPPAQDEHERLLIAVGVHPDQGALAAAWARGKSMSLDEAVSAGLETAASLAMVC